MIRKYPVLINKGKNSDWWVSFYDLSIQLSNANLDEVLQECQEAFEFYMEGETTLPSATPLEDVVTSEPGQAATALCLVDIDISFFQPPTA